jgi:hypothetical protein
MDRLKQRLNDLWMREHTSPALLAGENRQYPHCMGVTFRKPMEISGTRLSPGRYIFRLVDSGTAGRRDREGSCVQFFSDDRTKPFAELAPVLDN